MCTDSIRGPRNHAAAAQQNSSISGGAYSSGSVVDSATMTYTTSPTSTSAAVVAALTRRSTVRAPPSRNSTSIVTAYTTRVGPGRRTPSISRFSEPSEAPAPSSAARHRAVTRVSDPSTAAAASSSWKTSRASFGARRCRAIGPRRPDMRSRMHHRPPWQKPSEHATYPELVREETESACPSGTRSEGARLSVGRPAVREENDGGPGALLLLPEAPHGRDA